VTWGDYATATLPRFVTLSRVRVAGVERSEPDTFNDLCGCCAPREPFRLEEATSCSLGREPQVIGISEFPIPQSPNGATSADKVSPADSVRHIQAHVYEAEPTTPPMVVFLSLYILPPAAWL